MPNFVVQLVKVRRVTIPNPLNESPKEEDIWKSRPPESSNDSIDEEGKAISQSEDHNDVPVTPNT